MRALYNSIADLNRGCANSNTYCTVIYNKIAHDICNLLLRNGLIYSFMFSTNSNGKTIIKVYYKYIQDRRLVYRIRRVSYPGGRCYWTVNKLKRKIAQDKNVWVLSTSHGLLTMKEALSHNIGGEVLFKINHL